MHSLEALPDEDALYIAEHLGAVDVLRLLRCSKRFYTLITGNLHRLQRFDDLYIDIHIESDLSKLEFLPKRSTDYRRWLEIHFVPSSSQERTQEPYFECQEGRTTIKAYVTNTDSEDVELECEHNAEDNVQATKALLRFFRRRVSAHKMIATNVEFSTIRVLSPYFLSGLKKIKISNIDATSFADLKILEALQHWPDLIQFKTNIRIEDVVSEDFFRSSRVRQLEDIRFRRIPGEDTEDAERLKTDELTDELLLQLTARKLTLGPTFVTRNGLRKFLLEWNNKKREIQDCQFGIEMRPEADLDKALEVMVEGIAIVEKADEELTVQRSDGAKLNVILSREFDSRPTLVTVEIDTPKPDKVWTGI